MIFIIFQYITISWQSNQLFSLPTYDVNIFHISWSVYFVERLRNISKQNQLFPQHFLSFAARLWPVASLFAKMIAGYMIGYLSLKSRLFWFRHIIYIKFAMSSINSSGVFGGWRKTFLKFFVLKLQYSNPSLEIMFPSALHLMHFLPIYCHITYHTVKQKNIICIKKKAEFFLGKLLLWWIHCFGMLILIRCKHVINMWIHLNDTCEWSYTSQQRYGY